MALWILSRPRTKPETTERQVAEILSRLPDTWLIRWGFLYSRHDADAGEYEGDFLVSGPSGHILVMEVKGARVRNFVLTGQWEAEDGGESPWVQLNEEWQWARARADSVRGKRALPFFHRALALPFVHFVEGDRFHGEMPEESLVGAEQLQRFTAWWDEVVARVKLHGTAAEARSVFMDAFGEGLKPRAIKAFIQETERIFERSSTDDFRLLRMLEHNRQLMVQGGAGSGKTLLALQQAQSYSAQGFRTLLLCYNLALAEYLRVQVAKLPHGGPLIEVLSWEELTGRLLGRAGFIHEPPAEYAKREEYYTLTVPGYILEILAGNQGEQPYDAMVVDEAQDHDTIFPNELNQPHLLGWWHIYVSLLKGGATAPVTVFYDPAQRPRFRKRDGFDADRLRVHLSDCAHLRLPSVHRYTRPVYEYLRGLAGTGADDLVAQMAQPEKALPEGPEVECEMVSDSTGTANAVARIARRWEKLGFCRLRDVVVLGPRRELANSGVATSANAGALAVAEYVAKMESNELRYLSINRAKGLDFLGVIVIDLPDPKALPEKKDLHELLFMGASRARQLLGVVHRAPAPQVPVQSGYRADDGPGVDLTHCRPEGDRAVPRLDLNSRNG